MAKGEMLSKMLVLATTMHDGAYDRGGTPYIMHPLKVMHYLKTTDEELMCIALGHDLIEDTSVTYAHLLSAGMSMRVADGIMKLTKIEGESYEDYKLKVMSSVDAMLVKREDLRTNSDIRRLNKDVDEKDVARIAKYMKFHREIDSRLKALGLRH